MKAIDSREFRDALGSYPTGVAIITTLDPSGNPIGMTVNSFSSVSLDPPLVLWSIDRKSAYFDVFLRADHFAVHVLREDQQNLSRDFSSESPGHFASLEYDRGIANLPLLKSYSALFQCETRSLYDEGDHVILIGRVIDIRNVVAKSLVFVEGSYKRIAD